MPGNVLLIILLLYLIGEISVAQGNVKMETISPRISRYYFDEGMKSNILTYVCDTGLLILDTGSSKEDINLIRNLANNPHQPLRYVINSHDHWDHNMGNQIIDSDIILIRYNAIDRAKINNQSKLIRRITSHFNSYSNIRFKEDILLIKCPGMHSSTDILTYFTNQEVLHLGDLLLSQSFPSVGTNTKNYLMFLENILVLFPKTTIFIGGHGRALSHNELRDYLNILLLSKKEILEYIDNGLMTEEECKHKLYKKYDSLSVIFFILTYSFFHIE